MAIFRLNNSPGTDRLTKEDEGRECYFVDIKTVAKTDGDGIRDLAGIVHKVSPDCVWVKID
jgi:hypothetical protein